MNNEAILRQAISLLQAINTDNTETIQISNTVYDDGSISLSVEVNYPATEEESTFVDFYDGEDFKPEGSK